ncbi:hypothetical protein [Paenibacillus ehimensis]|uniref:Uncharacterized protein n=1 Tax=Paenibacillus ehimensis TaxID=79264 RepID=A0ABT8V5D0_9BACL|nr:hypothetical protein [Paenibacillus ehimensis]MDO3676643.1 hypothetical protein [Paenibacillus ehimensis]MEC0212849.1 hypothetical protein [Paenibacillus ehimensis]
MSHPDKITVNEKGLSITNGSYEALMEWAEIFRIHYSRCESELYVDRGLIFDYENGEFVEISDTAEGWDTLLDNLERYLAMEDSTWRQKIADCPNETVITIYVNDRMFQPECVNTLMIGDAPPGDGTFFFNGDSVLLERVKEAFAAALGEDVPEDHWDFLHFFRSREWFLVHLCSRSVKEMPEADRLQVRQQSVARLAQQIAAHRPLSIVCLHGDSKPWVLSALQLSGVEVERCVFVESPADNDKDSFVNELAEIVRQSAV